MPHHFSPPCRLSYAARANSLTSPFVSQSHFERRSQLAKTFPVYVCEAAFLIQLYLISSLQLGRQNYLHVSAMDTAIRPTSFDEATLDHSKIVDIN